MLTRERIINFDVNESSFDNLIIFQTELEGIKAGYQAESIKCPAWLSERSDETKKEIAARIRADKKRQLRLLQAKRESLLPDDVKLKNVEEEIENLKKELS